MSEGLELSSDVPAPRWSKAVYLRRYAEYSPLYGLSAESGDRTIKRWVALGKKADPKDYPPLDEPAKMAAWWRRHMKQTVPQALVDLEREETPVAPGVQAADVPGDAPRLPDNIVGIDLEGLVLGESEEVRQAASLVSASFQRLEAASSKGTADDYRRRFDEWKKSVEAYRTLKKEDREARKSSGKSLDRDEVMGELAQLIESLRLMGLSMPGKIEAELMRSTEGRARRIMKLAMPYIVAAVQQVRSNEASILANPDCLRSRGEAARVIGSTASRQIEPAFALESA